MNQAKTSELDVQTVMTQAVESAVNAGPPGIVERDERTGDTRVVYTTRTALVVVLSSSACGDLVVDQIGLESKGGAMRVIDAAGRVRVDAPDGQSFPIDPGLHPVEHAAVLSGIARASRPGPGRE